MVATNIGTGRRDRALRTAAIAAVLCEVVGLRAASAPEAWLSLFDSDPAMLGSGSRYLQIVGPFYGFFGLGLSLYFPGRRRAARGDIPGASRRRIRQSPRRRSRRPGRWLWRS
jgi:Na+-driven multidrug efflux pump